MMSETIQKRYMQRAPTTELMARTQQIIRTFESLKYPNLCRSQTQTRSSP
jgi:hypothetical protein